MTRLTKRVIDSAKPNSRDSFIWDSELRGFGVRLKASGTRTFIIQYRNIEGRTRRCVIGQYGVLTVEQARDHAKKKLASVVDGADPSAERHAVRQGVTISNICDWYLTEAEAGRLLGRNRRPIKASSISGDRSRIELHIKPLIGNRVVSQLKLADIECLQGDIAAGRTAKARKVGRGGRTAGGVGVASRAISTLRSLLNHARRLGLIEVTLRHSFASMAAALGFSELTISGLLGHAPRGITQRYVHLDTALVIAADQVAAEIARLLAGGELQTKREIKQARTLASLRAVA